MRFFTQAWHAGEYADSETENVRARYLAHLSELMPTLPADLRSFTEEIDVHDARIKSLILDRRNKRVSLELRAGDNERGYFDLMLTYLRVDVSTLDSRLLSDLAKDPESEALYDEVDKSREGYVHRWLWWPYREIDITFQRLTYERVIVDQRNFARSREPFVEIAHVAS